LPATLFYTHFQREQGAQRQMKLVVVGGQGRKVGKTSVIAGLIRGLSTFAWTAVKISHHAGDADSQETAQAAPGGGPTIDLGHYDLPAHLDFLLSEERDPKGHGDTSLYLAAGARRALWLRAREGRLADALPGLLEALQGDEHVIIESNSILAFLQPAVFLLVIGESGCDLKASARQFLGRADAFVTVRSDLEPGALPATPLRMPEDKPVFPVSPGEWSNPALYRFVGERLATAGGAGEGRADRRFWGPRLL
jgi:hypothetical protein